MPKVENLKEQLAKMKNQPWRPFDIALVNNHQIRLGLFKGDYGWHTHSDADEFFIVLEGKITIQTKEKNFVLRKGDYLELPKGTPHNLSSAENSYVLLVKPIHLKTESI
ncbi:MAG TPA: cupin domain-containing protein [Candidatus Limnocylindria bacterium]|nr:cupin domain-containing protein [Candidatus Limnocylindria bacterium]